MGFGRSTFYDIPDVRARDLTIVAEMKAICDEFEAYGYRRVVLFIRDVADNDFVGWIDRQLDVVDSQSPDRLATRREAVIGPLRNVYGVSDKVLAMALSNLLLGGAGTRRPLWAEIGGTFVAVDTLVHNFLHRTGILHRLRADHPYGDRCYRPGGCAETFFIWSP